MIFNCQKEPLNELENLCKSNRQSIIIEGFPGCGKTYLSKQYANMLQIDDFISVVPKVAEIREALDSAVQLQSPLLLNIENLDLGVAAASYTLLKSLEEPSPNLYIVITCRNIKAIPDTIISRSAVVTATVPTYDDLDAYGRYKDSEKFEKLKDRLVWRCARSFSDCDEVFTMNSDQINYYESLSSVCTMKDNISNLIWAISHYKSNEPCNLELAIRSIMELMKNRYVTKCGVNCLNDLSKGRIAQHAILAKFLFDIKYTE